MVHMYCSVFFVAACTFSGILMQIEPTANLSIPNEMAILVMLIPTTVGGNVPIHRKFCPQ